MICRLWVSEGGMLKAKSVEGCSRVGGLGMLTENAMRRQRSRASAISSPQMLILVRDPALSLDDFGQLARERQVTGAFEVGADGIAHSNHSQSSLHGQPQGDHLQQLEAYCAIIIAPVDLICL